MIRRLTGWQIRWLLQSASLVATILFLGGSVALAALLALHDLPESVHAASAVLWLVAVVGGLAAGARLVGAEHDQGGLRGVLLAPVDRRDVFLSRALALVVVIVALSWLAWGVTIVLFPALGGLRDLRVGMVLVVGALGLGPLGALAGWAALTARGGEVLGPALAIPLAAPLILSGVHAVEAVVGGGEGFEPSLIFAVGYALSVGAVSYAVSGRLVEVPS